MGSTSETYGNGTNVVIYVANENGHQPHHYNPAATHHNFITSNNNCGSHTLNEDDNRSVRIGNDNNNTVYNVCGQYGPSSVTGTDATATAATTTSLVTANVNYEGVQQQQNGGIGICNMGRSDSTVANYESFNGVDGCYVSVGATGNAIRSDTMPNSTAIESTTIFVNGNPASNASSITYPPTPEAVAGYAPVRSDSVRSVDSVASGSSGASSSKIVTSNEAAIVGGEFASSSSIVNFSDDCSVTVSEDGVERQTINDNYRQQFNVIQTQPSFVDGKDGEQGSFESKQTVTVPFGWKRLSNNGSVIYISPNNTILNSLEQVNSYLLTDGNCFCGLDCPLYSHTVFNFDPEVITSPVPATPGGLSKLCNHKRKRNVGNVIPPGANTQSQSYENTVVPPLSNNFSNRHIVTNYCNPAGIKKYGFDISDRRKRRKIMPGHVYVNEDVTVPSSNVIIRNDCDISAKENRNSTISPMSQVEHNVCNRQMGMTVGLPPEQQPLNPSSPMGPTMIRMQTPPFGHSYQNQLQHSQQHQPATYYNSTRSSQNDSFGIPSNDCYPVYSHHPNVARTNIPDPNNYYVTQDEYHMPHQNNATANNGAAYMCEPMKQGCGNMQMNQHGRLNFMPQQQQHHRVACNDSDGGPMRPPMVQQQQQQQQPPHMQFLQQRHFNQQSSMQQMRMVANNHVGYENGQQMVPNQSMGHQMEPVCELPNAFRIPNSNNTYCNCYHNENTHHMQHQQTQCGQHECGNGMMVPQTQVVVQQAPQHRMITEGGGGGGGVQQQMHHSNQHHNVHMQTQQMYPHHHAHVHQPPQPLQLPHSHPQHHHHQMQPQMQVMPNNAEIKNHCGPMQMVAEEHVANRQQQQQQQQQFISKCSTQTQPTRGSWPSKSIPANSQRYSETICTSSQGPMMQIPQSQPHALPHPGWNADDQQRRKAIKNTSKSPTNVGGAKKLKSIGVGGQGVPMAAPNTVRSKPEFTNNVPSFMDDPSGYLAQQTALLNSTISKQTGENCVGIKTMVSSSYTKTKPFDGRLPQAKTPDSSGQLESTCKSTSNRIRQHEENPVSSSTYSDRERVVSSSPTGSKSPIQAGTVSTSNESPGGKTSPTNEPPSPASVNTQDGDRSSVDSPKSNQLAVTAVASGLTSANNTITSVVAGGRANTAVVTTNNNIKRDKCHEPLTARRSSPPTTSSALRNDTNSISTGVNRCNGSCNANNVTNSTATTKTTTSTAIADVENTIIRTSVSSNPIEINKSPLEMVQNVVSSIQIPSEIKTSQPQSGNNVQTSHFLVSNNGQLLVATSGNAAQTTLASKVVNTSPISVLNNSSSVVTNVSGTVSQMIPAMGMTQQVLGQPTVLVNTLPSGQLVFQPSVMAVDGVGNAVQIPQLTVATGNVQTLADGAISVSAGGGQFSPRSTANLLSPESAKRKLNTKKRKLTPAQQMLQIAPQGGTVATTTSNVVVQSQPQQIAQSAPLLQTLILPNKQSQFASAQPLIATANVLQPVNLVHNIPTIQQFIVPAGLGGVVMNGDGTATLLPETMQLNVLTPMQQAANTVFSPTNQGILTASPGMVIRTQPNASQTTQLRSNGTQFIATQSPNQFIVNNAAGFSGQLSPIVASVSPNQQIHTFNTSPSATATSRTAAAPQEYLQCVNGGNGQTLMVPCSSVSQNTTNSQNTTVVQQNTTIVQQQMTMVSNNQQLENGNQSSTGGGGGSSTSNINLGQHNIILNDGKQAQNFIITTDGKSPSQTGYILSPKNTNGHDFILANNLNEKQSSFILQPSSATGSDKLCGNFILANASEKNTRGVIFTGDRNQHQNNRFVKHSISTQTAAAGQQVLLSSTPTLIVATNNTFSQQSSNSYTTSPPDTTTHSPVGTSRQSPDTPSSTFVVGSTDDVTSPTSSTMPGSVDLQARQPMVHCISSSNVVDWSESNLEEKKVNIYVDQGSAEIIAGVDVFPSLTSMHQQLQRRSSIETKESISYIESSTFDESSLRK